MARPVGLRGGCGVIGVGASRGRMAAVQPGRELWQRTQIDLRAPSHGPNGGVTDSLDEAKATFRAAGSSALDRRWHPAESRSSPASAFL